MKAVVSGRVFHGFSTGHSLVIHWSSLVTDKFCPITYRIDPVRCLAKQVLREPKRNNGVRFCEARRLRFVGRSSVKTGIKTLANWDRKAMTNRAMKLDATVFGIGSL